MTLEEAARDFLAQKRIAVAGVSRSGDIPANIIYKKLKASGYDVYAVNPHADRVEGDVCYPDLAAIPGGVDGVVIGAPADRSASIVQEAAAVGVSRVWMHRGMGPGSVDPEAVRLAEAAGLSVIPGGCPMMFCEPVDVAHRCARWFNRVTGREAVPVGYEA